MLTVYHGSTIKIMRPIAKTGRPLLDFGQGFYVTNIKEQAERWALRVSQQKLEPPILNIYDLDFEQVKAKFKYLKFDHYDQKWLDFIVSNRKGDCPWCAYDIVEGGVANDRVIDTVEAYISGFISIEMALGQLSSHQPNNQFCLINQQLIDECLHFKSFELLKGNNHAK